VQSGLTPMTAEKQLA